MIRLRDIATAMAISLLALGPAVAATGTNGVSSSEVRDVQQALKSQGLYQQGQVDGQYGPETRSAVEQFQQQHHLTANGRLDEQTLAALGVQGNTEQTAGAGNEQNAGTSGTGLSNGSKMTNSTNNGTMAGTSPGTTGTGTAGSGQENGSTGNMASTSGSSGVGTSMANGSGAGAQPSGSTVTGAGGNGGTGGGAGSAR